MTRRENLPLAVLLVFWAALYLPHLLARETLPARDVGATQIPWRTEWRAQLRSGWAPLWDPASNDGRPLLANPNAMAAYPGSLIFLLLPPEAAAAWHLALHHLLLLLGCYALARRLGGDHGAAAVGAVAAGAGGVAWSVVTFMNTQASLAWAVWALAAAVPPPGPGRPARTRALAVGALLGLSFLAGEPVTAGFGAAACAVVALTSWRPRPLRALAIMAGAAVLLAAPVLLPLLAVFPETVRGGLAPAPGALAADALAPRRWLELLFPNLLGAPLGDLASGFWAAPSFPWQRYFPVIFVGAVPLLCLGFAMRAGRRLAPWWGLAAAGVAGAGVLAVPGLADRAQDLPLLGSVRFAIKFLELTVLALPPLVAAGWTELRRRWATSGRRAGRVAAITAAALIPVAVAPDVLLRPTLAALYPASRAALAEVPAAGLRRAALVDSVALAAPLAALAVAGPSALVATAATLVAGAAGGAGVLLFDRNASWAAPPPAVAAMAPHATLAVLQGTALPHVVSPLARFRRQRRDLLPQFATRWGIGYVLMRGPDGLEPVRGELLAAGSAHLDPAGRARLAAALGADAVVCAAPLPGWPGAEVDGLWVGTVAPPPARVYLARRLLPADNMLTAATIMAAESFRPGADAVVAGGGGATALAGGQVRERPGPPYDRRFDVAARGPGLLVVQQSFMRCWRVRVDGRPAALEVVNGVATGVRVPAGRHRVELALDLAPYRIGAAGPLLLLLFAALNFAAGRSRARAATSGGEARTPPATPPAP